MTPHLCHVFPSFAAGGSEVRAARLINALGDAYRHSLVSFTGDFGGQNLLQRADTVQLVPGPVRRGRLRHPFDLACLLRSLSPEVILTYGWGGTDGILAARLAGYRRIIHAEDGFLPEEVSGEKWSRRWARRILLNRASCVVVPSQGLARIAQESWRVPPQQIRYVPNGIDVDRFAPPTPAEKLAARHRFCLPAQGFVIGTVGRLSAEKNQARLLRVFAALAGSCPCHLVFFGDGPMRAELERQASELGLSRQTYFTGAVANVPDCYRALDVFALSSDTEQMPLVILEAMATGLPIVSTAVGDVPDMLPDLCRECVVPREDEAAFALQLKALIEDENRRRTFGEANCLESRNRFDARIMIAAYNRLYHEVLNN